MVAQRIVDMKFPITWLIGTGSVIVASMVTFYVSNQGNQEKMMAKVDAVLTSTVRLEKRVDDQYNSSEALKDRMYQVQRLVDTHTIQISGLERVRR